MRLADAMRNLGVKRGDRVAILALNSDRYLEVYQALFWLGAAITPANTRWSVEELVHSFRDCEAGILFVDEIHLPLAEAIRAKTESLRELIYLGDGTCPSRLHDFEVLISEATPIDHADPGNDDLAGIFYTGGTTGFSKGVMLSHQNLVAAVCNRLAMGWPVGEVYLHAAPLFHMVGALGMLWEIMSGGTHVVISGFTPEAFLEAVQRERVTDTGLVPTMMQMVLDHPDFQDYDLSSLSFIVYGAAPISETLLERIIGVLPQLRLAQAYGMTEVAGPAAYLTPSDHDARHRSSGRLRSAGRAAALAEIRIVDAEHREVPRGVVGEIAMRGMSVMLGYWKNPAETAKTLQDGWVYSGDAGYMDDEGYIFVVDRIKDMIVSGGENVYSVEVENVMLRHPAVAACAAIGIPHETWGEAVHVLVVPRAGMNLTEAEAIAHCKMLIAGYKCPRSVEFIPAIPLSSAGKVLKNKLREPYWNGKGRQVN